MNFSQFSNILEYLFIDIKYALSINQAMPHYYISSSCSNNDEEVDRWGGDTGIEGAGNGGGGGGKWGRGGGGRGGGKRGIGGGKSITIWVRNCFCLIKSS